MLPNGNILVAGGTRQYDPFYGLRTSYEYDWVTRQFVRVPSMAAGRWYPGATQLGSGDVFVLSGLNGVGALNRRAEFYRHRTRTWNSAPYLLSVPTYAHMLPTAGGRLFFTGVSFGGSVVRVGFLSPLTGGFQPVGGLDTNRRDQGASFFVPFSQGRKVLVAGGGVATTTLIDLYSSPNPVYRPGPSLDQPKKYLSHIPPCWTGWCSWPAARTHKATPSTAPSCTGQSPTAWRRWRRPPRPTSTTPTCGWTRPAGPSWWVATPGAAASSGWSSGSSPGMWT
jgi:hypothetical protein